MSGLRQIPRRSLYRRSGRCHLRRNGWEEVIPIVTGERRLHRREAVWTLSILLLGCRQGSSAQNRPLRIAAASDVEPVFSALAEHYRQTTGREVVLSFSASGVLAKQIEHGAPFDLYVSASDEHIARLRKKGRLVPSTIRPYGRGQLALWKTGDGPLPNSLRQLAEHPNLRIAIANPEHAPYGAAAVAALRSAGVYEQFSRRLVIAENVRQAQMFTESGNTDLSIIARSLAGRSGRFVEIPLNLHPPIVQTLAAVSGGNEAQAREFADLLDTSLGRQLLRDSGFLPPPSGL